MNERALRLSSLPSESDEEGGGGDGDEERGKERRDKEGR